MSVLQTMPLGSITLHICSAAPTHSATAGDLAINKAGGVDTFLYECTGGTTWTANATGGGGGGSVSSVFTRTGAVVAATNDYAFSQISGTAAIGQIPTGSTGSTVPFGNDSRFSDARTPTSHVLATNVALGGQQTVSGLTAGQVLRAASATTANFQALAVGDLPTGTSSSTVALGDAPAAAITAHVALADPHTQYALDTDKGTASGIATLTASSQLTASQFPALTGDVTTAGGALATTLKATGTAGTYKSVTTDAQGRVTAGTNPTTLSGYGITDAAPIAPQYVCLAADATLTNERVLTAGTGITLTDAGAGAALTVASKQFALRASANVALSASATINITALDITVASGETWVLLYSVPFTVSGGTVGLKPIFTLPASSTGNMLIEGNTTGVGVYATLNSTTPATASATAFGTASFTGGIWVSATITMGASGTCRFGVTTGASAAGNLLLGASVMAMKI